MFRKIIYILCIAGTMSHPSFSKTNSTESVQGQDKFPSAAFWELSDPALGGTGMNVIISGQILAGKELLSNTEINQYTGPEESQRIRIAGNEWPANQTGPIENVYVEFTLSSKPGYLFTPDSISFGIAAASIGTMKADVFISTDPEFLNPVKLSYSTGVAGNYLRRDSLTRVKIKQDFTGEGINGLYLRFYPWVDNDPAVRTGKYLCLRDVKISGFFEPVPGPARAEWLFETDDRVKINGLITAENTQYGEAMVFNNITELPVKGKGEKIAAGTFLPLSGQWFGSAGPADSLSLIFEAGPNPGGIIRADSLSFYLGAISSDNLKASVFLSTDPSFAETKILLDQYPLSTDSLEHFLIQAGDSLSGEERIYLRLNFYNSIDESGSSLTAVSRLILYATSSGSLSDPPEVQTRKPDNISASFAVSGGNITSDGGSEVTARGVVWNISGSPELSDFHTNDGKGTGSFTSILTGLQPGQSYFLRAYASNAAATSYGEEFSFTCLESVSPPVLTTSVVSGIMTTSAECGGNITEWGGDSITSRGVYWNTTGNPGPGDDFTLDGLGTSPFVSYLYPLLPGTTYFVRAYATNDAGTGFGQERSFTTKTPAPDLFKTVASDGTGDYSSVQEAFDAVPDNYTGKYFIYVKKGIYYEKLLLASSKTNVVLVGEDRDSTILSYDDYAGKAGGTSSSYSVSIEPDDFIAMNISFRNTVVNDGSFADQQGVALRVNGDRQAYYNCRLLGYQDTYYAYGGRKNGRIYMHKCYIEGSVDFIFGRDLVVFDSCEIHINRNGGSLTAASTENETRFGLVFRNCRITAEETGFNGIPITDFILGRPWQASPRTVFIECEEPASLKPEGWASWNVAPALYAEYKCFGPGSDYSRRLGISRQLSDEEALDYNLANMFSRNSHPSFSFDWMPVKPELPQVITGPGDQVDGTGLSFQNFPNPAANSTRISYMLSKTARIRIELYNSRGQLIHVIADELKQPGSYEHSLETSMIPDGIYFYSVSDGINKSVNKLIVCHSD